MMHKVSYSLVELILLFNVVFWSSPTDSYWATSGCRFVSDDNQSTTISIPAVADAKTPQYFRHRRPSVELLTIRGGGEDHNNHHHHQRRQQQQPIQQSPFTPKSIRGGEAAWQSGVKNSLASALAAASSKLLLAPLDTIKTLQQHQRVIGQGSLTLVGAARQILSRPKGFLELYAGIGVAMVGAMPSVGLYFGIYSFCKKTFNKWDPEASEGRKTLYIALSAAIGNTIASGARVPYEVVKQNLQTKVYENFADAMSKMSVRTLFPMGGIASQMLRDIPYAVITLLSYEHLKHVWKPRAEDAYPDVPKRTWDLLVGGVAGGFGSFLTNPMDVIKTRLQTDGGTVYSGSILKCSGLVWEEGGASAFLRGSVPRLLHKVPANAFFFLFYEFFRSMLNVKDDPTQ